MTATGPEQNGGNGNQMEALKAELARQSAAQLAEQVKNLKTRAEEVRIYIDETISKDRRAPSSLPDSTDKDSVKAKGQDIKKTVQKVLLAAKMPDKIPSPTGKSPEATSMSTTVIQKLSDQIHPEFDISELSAPYLHQLINKAVNGELATVNDLAVELQNMRNLAFISPELFRKVQASLVNTAKENSTQSEEELKRMFGVREQEAGPNRGEDSSRQLDDQEWERTYGSYFNPGDRPFVESLYSPTKFVEFTEKMKDDMAAKIGQPRESDTVAKEVSKEYERKMVELFGKLYTRLDHEKPSEFFHEIEQQDIMRGILPVKNELKRRMTLLATELERAEEEGKVKDPGLYQRVELRPDLEDIKYEAKEGEDKTRIKPRYRLTAFTEPKKTEAAHFIHYLDQIVDQYVEARKYTHNARAIFLHPVDPEKGFYSQLAQFANDMTMVDFEQLMALPDNEVFRDAFSMYDKVLEETFASNDWRHFPTMFELKKNSLHTQLEEDVIGQLKKMYLNRPDITDARLEAALSMAVGASRGMFLNEIEKAAFADPHLTEDGKPTFASYYNQDASALVAFNPMHQFYRWQAPNTMDPILFMPVEGFKGSKTFTSDHTELWKKMQGYKDSFVNGRKSTGIEGETLFADFVVNIGKVGGPLQRKGWRTRYMLEPLFVKDESNPKFLKYDYFKTWQRFENIGYEVTQDFVANMGPLLGQYEGKKGGDPAFLKQKQDLLGYLYGKYFDKDPAGVGGYMNGLRAEAEKSVIDRIKAGKISPKNIREQVEIDATNTFLYRALARMVAHRIPSKLLRIDRDRMSSNGISRWREIANDMFPKDKLPPGQSQTAMFDDVMKDLLVAEQLLRKEVSEKMRGQLAQGKEAWHNGEIAYRLTEQKIEDLLKGRYDDKPGRIDQVKELYRRIQGEFTNNEKYLDGKLANMLKNTEYKFSFALDEVDMTFIPFRGAGARVLPRAIGDISVIEKNVSAEVTKFPKLLQQMAIDGKHDAGPVLESLTKIYGALDGIIGTDYAHQVVHHLAAMTINYFKKDTRARYAGGIFGIGRKNSLAAERAGRGTAVWEWDSRQIDNFCVALETRALLPLKPYSPVNTNPETEPMYVNIPGLNPIKLPESVTIFGKKVSLFEKRKPDFQWSIKDLRDQFGGNWKDKTFDILTNFGPIVMLLILWKYIKDANKEAEGGGKKK